MAANMNVEALYNALDKVREAKDWSWYRVSQDTGISQSTFSRLKRGKEINTEKLFILANWCGADAARFIRIDSN